MGREPGGAEEARERDGSERDRSHAPRGGRAQQRPALRRVESDGAREHGGCGHARGAVPKRVRRALHVEVGKDAARGSAGSGEGERRYRRGRRHGR